MPEVKGTECAGLIGNYPLSLSLNHIHDQLQSVYHLYLCIMSDSMLESPVDPDDTQLVCYLTSAWAKIDQAFGKELESYLTLIVPHILETANAKMDISVYGMCTFVLILSFISSFHVQRMKRRELIMTAMAGRL